jgi:hypothetical protein
VAGGISQRKRVEKQLGAAMVLVAVAEIARMVGDSCREGAVLVLVFVPLEYWKVGGAGGPFGGNWVFLLETVAVAYAIGLIGQGVSLLAYRWKRNLEGVDGTE